METGFRKTDRQTRVFFIQLWVTLLLFLCVIVAFAFYLRAGWHETESYGKYAGRPEAICFDKEL